MNDRLRPCPFCGNEHPEIASGDSVICNWHQDGIGCGCSAFFDQWNRRVPGPATKAMLDWCEAYIEHTELDLMLEFLGEWNR